MVNLITDKKLTQEVSNITRMIKGLEGQLQADDHRVKALRRAQSWLKDITEPLTEEETAVWEVCGQVCCEEEAGDLDSCDYNEMLTEEDRRGMVEYCSDMAKDA